MAMLHQAEPGEVGAGILAIAAGAFTISLAPAAAVWGGMMLLAGALSITNYCMKFSHFDKLWRNLNLCVGESRPILKGKEETETSTIYRFTLPPGISTDDFENKKLAIEQYLGCEINIKYTYKEVYIEAYKNDFEEFYPYEFIPCRGNVEFPIGYSRNGKLIMCDLATGEPHMLIAGETGSGKSTILRSIITNLILAGKVKLHLIDLKRGAEFQIFSRCRNVLDFARTRSEAEAVLNKISAEIDRRYDLFQQRDCVDIREYNKRVAYMGYEVLIVDEFADLKMDKSSINTLEDIAAKARACGIHLIISTQRPDRQVLEGRIKANVTTVLGLKTTNETNSRIIVDDTGLQDLKQPGQGIYKRGTYKTTVQCLNLTTEHARELLRPTYVEKPVQPKAPSNGEITDFEFLEVL